MTLSAIFREIYADRLLYLVVAIYAIVCYATASGLGMESRFHPLLYAHDWVPRGLFFVLPIALISVLIGRVRGVYESERLQNDFPRWIAGFLLVLLLVLFHGVFTSAKNLLPAIAPFTWDVFFADLDQQIHGGVSPDVLLAPIFEAPGVARLIDDAYSVLWFIVIIAVSGYAAVSPRVSSLRVRYFATFFFVWIFVGNVLASIFMSAGPCFYGKLTGDADRFAGLLAALPPDSSALVYQQYLWSLFEAGKVGLGTGISAFPSVHLGAATVVAAFLANVDRRLGWLGAGFVVLMLLGSISLGWHYAVDGYASIIIAAAAWKAFGYLGRIRAPGGSSRHATPSAAQRPA